MVFGFGKKKGRSSDDEDEDDDEEDDDDEDDDDEEEEEVELVLFQGALNGKDPNLAANARLVQAGLQPAKVLITEAISRRAEMVRVEPKGPVASVALYVDGIPYPAEKMPSQVALAVTQMVKLLAGIDLKEKGKKQTGGIKAQYLEGKYTLRVDTEPLQTGGERLTIRSQSNAVKMETPADLGWPESLRVKVREQTSKKQGLILAVGPPMSGVTTTCLALVRTIDAYLFTIYSLLGPDSKELLHVKAFIGNPGDNFEQTVTRAKRQEADVMFVAPIREAENAKVILNEAEDETCFVAEFAAKDCYDAVMRLVQLVGDPKLVAARLNLLVSQKLVRLLCEKCRQAYRPHPSLLAKVGLPAETKVLYRPPQKIEHDKDDEEDDEDEEPEICTKCGGIGYFGRVGLIECLEVTDEIRKVIAEGGSIDALRSAGRKAKMQSFQSDGIRLVGTGKTSLEELQRIFKAT